MGKPLDPRRVAALALVLVVGTLSFGGCSGDKDDHLVRPMIRCLRAEHISVETASYWQADLGVPIPRDLVDFYSAALPHNDVILGVFETERSARMLETTVLAEVKEAFEGQFVDAIGRKDRTVLIWLDVPSRSTRARVEGCIGRGE